MLEKNYRTYCAQQNIQIDDRPLEQGEGEGDEEMDDAADEWEGMNIDEDEDELPQFFKEERDRKKEEKMSNPTKRKKKGRVSELVRSKVKKVLDNLDLSNTRARMCDQNHFLGMLEGFNEEGIHFA